MGRNKTTGAMFLLSALVTALLAMTALGASAQEYPPEDAASDTTEEQVPPGGTQTFVCIECFDADSDVVITVVYSDETTQTFNAKANAEGTLRFEFRVPEDAPEGEARIEARGMKNGQPVTYVETFMVLAAAAEAPADGDEVAATGAGVTNLMVLVVAFLVLGGGALAYAKTRGTKDEDATTTA